MKTVKKLEALLEEYYETFKHWSPERRRQNEDHEEDRRNAGWILWNLQTLIVRWVPDERSISMKAVKKIEAALEAYYETFKHWLPIDHNIKIRKGNLPWRPQRRSKPCWRRITRPLSIEISDTVRKTNDKYGQFIPPVAWYVQVTGVFFIPLQKESPGVPPDNRWQNPEKSEIIRTWKRCVFAPAGNAPGGRVPQFGGIQYRA